MNVIPLSVVIIARNEERNIEACLKSVHGWAAEIVVVDDVSTDRTVELARKYTERIFSRKMDIEGTHRNWSLSQATHDWVLVLDADERVTEDLRTEINNVLPSTDKNAFTIPRRNFIGSHWLKYGGQYPSAQLRLFSKSRSRLCYEEVEVHPRIFFERPEGRLKSDIIHYSYRDIEHFLGKLGGQSTLEARKWHRTGRKVTFGKMLWRSVDRFFRSYYRKKGRKDGIYGFVAAYLAGVYQIVSFAKYWELRRGNAAFSHKDQPSPEIIPWKGEPVPMTVLIMTKNEEDNIEDCLRSVHGWAGEIVVIDDNSTDRTREIATRYADKVIRQTWVNEGTHRNGCIRQAQYDWVMFLDADEMVTDALRRELAEEVKKGQYDSFSLPLKTYIGKTWVRHGGWYPAHKLRVMDRRKQWFKEEKVHPTPANAVTCKKLTGDVFHKGYPDFEHFLGSVNRQSTAEAKKWLEESRPMTFGKAFWRALDRFFRIYLRKQACRDGMIGFMVAYLAALYQLISYAKYWQMKTERVQV